MPGSDFYIWQAGTHTVRIALDLVDTINAALNDPRNARDEECGGILLGRVREPESIELCGFEPIRSEHHRGTIFGLGLREQQRVARRVGVLAKRRSLRPVGFFRTHLRPGLYLDQDDFALMQEGFGDPSNIALLIRPAEPGPPNGGIFVWEDGDIDRRRATQLFPFDSATLRVEGPIENAPAVPEPRKNGLRMPTIPKPVLGWSIAAVAGLLLVAGGLGTAHWLTGRSQPESAARPLNLQMRKSGDGITIDWDRKATSLQSASSALLTIRDGSEEQKLTLNRGDLQHGNVQFWPRSNDVSVRMDVGGAKADQMSARAEPPQPAAVIAPPKTEPSPAPRKATPEALPYIEPAHNDPVVAARYSDEEPDVRPTSLPPVAATRPAPLPSPTAAPRVEREERAAVGTLPHPVPVAAAPEPRNTPPVEPTKVVRRAPKPTGVAVSVQVEHRNSREIRKVVGRMPLLGRSFRGDGNDRFSPARPAQPIEPLVPDSIARDVVGDVDVDVRLSLDKHGAVKNAEILNGMGSELANLAANSATSAMWEPAYDGDRPVASDVVVHYRFKSRD